MPQPFNNAVMTDGGASLLSMVQAGEIKIQFTRMAIGSGTYSREEKMLEFLQSATGLKEERNSFLVSSVSVHNKHSVKLTALISNQDPSTGQILIEEGYYINEIGLFAKAEGADNEVLYSIAVTSGDCGDFMPPYNGYHPAQIVQEYYVTVNNTADVILQAGSGAVALAEDLLELQRKMEQESAENSIKFEQIQDTFDKMYSMGSLEDIDRIIDGTYVEEEDSGDNFDWGTNRDIDDIIAGTYVESESEDVQAKEKDISDIVEKAFKEVE